MPKFILTYHQPQGYVPGANADAMAAWQTFLESIADRVVDPGQPVSDRRTLGAVDATTQLGGYSIVDADDLTAAIALADGCPSLTYGGGVQVGELMELPADHIAAQLRERVASS